MNIFERNYWSVLITARLKQLLNSIPFYKDKKYTFFLIIGHPRTGTSLLHTYLNSHHHILSLNEPLSDTNNLRELLKPYSKVLKAVGCKYFYEYIFHKKKRAALVQLLQGNAVKVVKIHRKNYLRTYLSLRIAEKTKEWSATGETMLQTSDKRIRLSREECVLAFSRYKEMESQTNDLLQAHQVPIHEITYEELDAYPNEVMKGVQYFLGVKPAAIVSLLIRQNPETLSELIEEYSVLKEQFKGTDYEDFFE